MDNIKGQKFTVKHSGPLLDYLYELFPQQSKKGVKAYLTNSQILVNGRNVTAFDAPLFQGDTIVVIAKGVSIANSVRTAVKEDAEDQGVEILYEDEHFIVVNKKAGIPTIEPARRNLSPSEMTKKGEMASFNSQKRAVTVYSILSDFMKTRARSDRKNLKIFTGSTRIWIVHRLDRDTSGILLFAKDEKTKDLMQSKWNSIVYERKYVAFVEGAFDPAEGTIVSWLKEDPNSLKVWSNEKEIPGSDKAVTHYKTLEKRGNYSLVEFQLETGRKNQIRVQALSKGHPIAGDRKYDAKTNPIGRLALHAETLVFRDPYTNETLSFSTKLPKEFSKIK